MPAGAISDRFAIVLLLFLFVISLFFVGMAFRRKSMQQLDWAAQATVDAAIRDAELNLYETEWEELLPDKVFTFVHADQPGMPQETKTVREWIEQNGEGFFATTEY